MTGGIPFLPVSIAADVSWGLLAGAAVACLGTALALHWLRVRLRRVPVESLLFFQLAGMTHQPRVLWGSPRRLLALLLGLLLMACLLGGWAGLRLDPSGPSRVLVLEGTMEPDAAGAFGFDSKALFHGKTLGERGAVLTLDRGVVRTVLRADESIHLLPVRLASMGAGPHAPHSVPMARTDGLQAARSRLERATDEILWLHPPGWPPPPAQWRGIPVRSEPFTRFESGRAAHARRQGIHDQWAVVDLRVFHRPASETPGSPTAQGQLVPTVEFALVGKPWIGPSEIGQQEIGQQGVDQPQKEIAPHRIVVAFTDAKGTRRVMHNAPLTDPQAVLSLATPETGTCGWGEFAVPCAIEQAGTATIELHGFNKSVELASCTLTPRKVRRVWVDDKESLPPVARESLLHWPGWQRTSQRADADVVWSTASMATDAASAAYLPTLRFHEGHGLSVPGDGPLRATAGSKAPFHWNLDGATATPPDARILPSAPNTPWTPWVAWREASGRAVPGALVDAGWVTESEGDATTSARGMVRILTPWFRTLPDREALRILDDAMEVLSPESNFTSRVGTLSSSVSLNPAPQLVPSADGEPQAHAMPDGASRITYRMPDLGTLPRLGWLVPGPGPQPQPQPSAEAESAAATKTTSTIGSGFMGAWWFMAALVLLLVDTWLYHRGRLP